MQMNELCLAYLAFLKNLDSLHGQDRPHTIWFSQSSLLAV